MIDYIEDDDKLYLESHLPEYLEEDLTEFKRLLRENSPWVTSYWSELNSAINIVDVEGEITAEQAQHLRAKYLGLHIA